jgi:hypothetical protein
VTSPVPPYSPKTEPWAHQVQALERLRGRMGFALLMAMRTGKTKVILDDFGRLWAAGHVDDLLVIAPAGVYRTWIKAISDHLGEPTGSQLQVKLWSAHEGDSKVAKRKWQHFMTPDDHPRCLLVNVEALSTVKRARELVLAFCRQRRVYSVIDEATTVKSPRSKRARFLVQQVGPLCEARRILTGLVAPKDPGDVFQQFQFLKPGLLGFDSYHEFQSRYAITEEGYGRGKRPGEPQKFTKVLGWRDQDELSARMAPYSFRVRLKDCYDLPPKIYETRDVELTQEQERVYKELREYATVELEESVHVTATHACTLALRLHQVVCGHVGDEQGIRRTMPTNRVQAVLDVIDEWDGDKAIVWCAYDQDIRAVSEALLEAHGLGTVARFWGGNRHQREEEEAWFLYDPRCRFMVATPQAGGRGRTWSVADMVIYHSNTQDLEARDQSEERAQGVDKARSVLYVDLVGRFRDGSKTIDSAYLHSLRQKITMAALLMGDGWRDWVV